MLALIVAMAENRCIGINNTLPWRLSNDLQYFKKITTGNAIIMGRKTYDSIGRPLPNRRNIIITRQEDLVIPGCEVVNSIEQAQALTKGTDAFIIGGAEIYTQSLELVDRIYLTQVKANVEGDAFFTEFSSDWKTISEEKHLADEKNQYDHSFLILEK